MWWKFWTWSGKGTQEQSSKNARSGDESKSPAGSASSEPEDILTSISGLIDEQIEIDGEKRRRKNVKSTQNAESNDQPSEAALSKATWSDVNPQNTVTTELIEPLQRTQPAPTNPQIPAPRPNASSNSERVSTPIRVPSMPTHPESQKESMRTLTAEDGVWPSFKGITDSFKDLDDDDEPDGSSPFQTIVPKDD